MQPDLEKEEKSKDELEFNKKNRQDYEQLMKDSSTNLDGYWDKNNPFVKIFLFILGIIIIFGVVFYLFMYINGR